LAAQWSLNVEISAAWLDTRVDRGPADDELLGALSSVVVFDGQARWSLADPQHLEQWIASLTPGAFRKSFDSLLGETRRVAKEWGSEEAIAVAEASVQSDPTYLAHLLGLSLVKGLHAIQQDLHAKQREVLLALRG
jgi:hypothetical protein